MCKKDKLESHKKYLDRLNSIVRFDWKERLNDYDTLGLPENMRLSDFSWKNKEFPLIGKATKLSDYDILDTLRRPENFRLMKQNLLGMIREWHFIQLMLNKNKILRKADPNNEVKIDFVLPNGKKIQVKGITKSISRDGRPCIEVKSSHGRIPQRLYKKNTFDFLVVVLDPFVIPKKYIPHDSRNKFNCIIIPESHLPIHHRSEEWNTKYYKDVFCFTFDEYVVNQLNLFGPCICDLKFE